ncbi:hypothetical protein MASR2M48_31660 [Spirochaetota bacterium]
MSQSILSVRPGHPRPFGATPVIDGVNFSVFSRNATSVRLCLYDKAEDSHAMLDHRLDPIQNKTGDIWHIQVEGIGPGALYAWRVDGPFMPERGYRFNPNKILIDPYAKALSGNSPGNSRRPWVMPQMTPGLICPFQESTMPGSCQSVS